EPPQLIKREGNDSLRASRPAGVAYRSIQSHRPLGRVVLVFARRRTAQTKPQASRDLRLLGFTYPLPRECNPVAALDGQSGFAPKATQRPGDRRTQNGVVALRERPCQCHPVVVEFQLRAGKPRHRRVRAEAFFGCESLIAKVFSVATGQSIAFS